VMLAAQRGEVEQFHVRIWKRELRRRMTDLKHWRVPFVMSLPILAEAFVKKSTAPASTFLR
jgi:hypothetical protein